MRIVNPHKTNAFSKHRVDKDIQSIVLPLNLSQVVFLQFKYLIKDNFIQSHTPLMNGLSICSILSLVMLQFYEDFTLLNVNIVKCYLDFALLFEYCLHCSKFITTFIVNFVQRDKNIELVLTIQEIHRFISEKRKSKMLIIGNWISIIIVYFLYTSVVITTNIFIRRINLNLLSRILINAFFDLDMLYTIRIIKLLKDKVHLWNDRLLNSPINYEKKYSKKMLKVYTQILDCYHLFNLCFRHVVSFFYSLLE